MSDSKIQIVATLGPVTKSKDIIAQLIEHQMDLARLNFSYGSGEEHAEFIANIRQAAREQGKNIPIIADLSGPRVSGESQHQFDNSAVSGPTDKDIKDLEFAIKHTVEYVALSFVGSAEDVLRLKEEAAKLNGKVSVIAKIERQKALDNLDEIINASDAVMIARGDLGNEVPLEKIPFIEKNIIQKCKEAKKPVIVATQMLFSMTENPQPSRAEVTDVAFAIISGADAVMLSEETTTGKYPLEAIKMMEKIIIEAQKHLSKLQINSLQ